MVELADVADGCDEGIEGYEIFMVAFDPALCTHDRRIEATRVKRMSETSQVDRGDESIRPYRIDIPQEDIDDLKRRLANTRWPTKETASGWQQGGSAA
jgi:hypothetical protein